jgi:hypothetical protein
VDVFDDASDEPPIRGRAVFPASDQRAFSTNGSWVAYQSNETGTPTIYVQPFPATGARFQASLDRAGDDPHHRSGRGMAMSFSTSRDRTALS